MRRVCVLTAIPFALFFLFAPSPIGAESAQTEATWSFHSEVDLFLGLKAGAEYRLSEHWGLGGSLGLCLISPLQTTYTLLGIDHLCPREGPFQFDLEFGLIQAIFNVLEPLVDIDPDIDWASAYWVPGAALSVGYRSPGGHIFAIRLGAGIIFGYDIGSWRKPSFHPNFALTYDYRPSR